MDVSNLQLTLLPINWIGLNLRILGIAANVNIEISRNFAILIRYLLIRFSDIHQNVRALLNCAAPDDTNFMPCWISTLTFCYWHFRLIFAWGICMCGWFGSPCIYEYKINSLFIHIWISLIISTIGSALTENGSLLLFLYLNTFQSISFNIV